MTDPRSIEAVDTVEVLCLQDNYIDMALQDNSTMVRRASILKNGEINNSIRAEHGFSVVVRTGSGDTWRTMLFDFGFSPDGAACNAKLLGAPLHEIDSMALSHGHSDHTGGIAQLTDMTGRNGIPLFCHPGVFTPFRYLEPLPGFLMHFPRFDRKPLEDRGIRIVETTEPQPLPGNHVLFLGEIPRKTDFEKGFPIAYRDTGGTKAWDPIEDDSAIVINLRDKGLIIISGCAHAGIVNTVIHAKQVTGIDSVHAVMGGFHLTGPLFEAIIERTTEELINLNPEFVVPCHCTGRKATMFMEQKMPDRFIFNMSGTRLTFRA
ncbi:MAG: MBL fold metallo-hydrolase [Syntrophales bacterium]|jgi:7,8-dihydropterin-6-yl-methyl-4-(beta-D-ribofuranosyl)aminobenzene 5'-phosphate synthase|nr:MBL fold metallo-hydrolase [Syntrophales bacterium]MCK9528542.1 MBL fold metallo-hydrolase [Syntrophales bacterium]MDX9922831.1 MBL fold metallo-hydrolase [Syntrophales bacterium]